MNRYLVIILSLTLYSHLYSSPQFIREVPVMDTVVHSAQTFDYNKDGLKDLIFSANSSINIALAPNFRIIKVASHSIYKKASIHSMIMDVDSDGDQDFICADHGVVWFENPSSKDPNTPWKATWITKKFTGQHCFIKHDVDLDGKLDIVTNNFFPINHAIEKKFPNKYPDSVIWFPVPKKPTVSSNWKANLIAKNDAGGGSHYLGFADLNGDHKAELLQGSKGEPFENGHYYAYWTRTTVVNQPWKKHLIPGSHKGATHLYGGDFNLDGEVDLIGSKGHGTGISLFLGPKWDEVVVDNQLITPHAFTTSDIDKDGDIDLFACAKTSKKAVWFENDGKGNFKHHLLSDNQQAYDIFIDDLEGDGDLDIIIAGQGSKNIVFYKQQ